MSNKSNTSKHSGHSFLSNLRQVLLPLSRRRARQEGPLSGSSGSVSVRPFLSSRTIFSGIEFLFPVYGTRDGSGRSELNQDIFLHSTMCVFSGRDNGEAAAYAGVNYAGSATGGGGGAAGYGGNGYGSLGMVYGSSGDWSCRSHSMLSWTTLALALICLHPL